MQQVTPPTAPPRTAFLQPDLRWKAAPLLRAPENSETIFRVTACVAVLPLLSGLAFYGWRCAMVAALSVATCLLLEWSYFRIWRSPAQPGRSHSLLTGLLLALTLPASAPWYAPVIAAAFAMIVGKAIFGGVGHFLWQPALLGRLAVAVMLGSALQPSTWPLLSPAHVLTGNADNCRETTSYYTWRQTPPPEGADGWRLPRPPAILHELGSEDTRFTSIADAISRCPSMAEVMLGAVPGGIGESCPLAILLAGLYLIHRNYVKWILPAAFIGSAALVISVAPVCLAGTEGVIQRVWFPLGAERADVGFTYVNYQLFGGELLLAAFFLAPEMTSRPTTVQGQLLFGLGCGTITMLLQLYALFPLSAYVAVLAMNSFTPLLDRITRPRVLGGKPWWKRLLHAGAEE